MNTIFAALLGLPTGKMNYHNIICRLSAPIQFHSEINEQLLGVIRGSVLSPQAPCGWAEPWQTNRWPWPGWGASRGLHTGSKCHIQTSRKAQITWKLWQQILAVLVFWYNGGRECVWRTRLLSGYNKNQVFITHFLDCNRPHGEDV